MMFISFEGPEGSGKSTVIRQVSRALEETGFPILLTREPGGTPIAEEIRQIILDQKNTSLDARAEALLYAASRRQHLVEKIWPSLQAGKVVLCDRFLDSSLAYQGVGRDLGIDDVLKINMFATEGTFPDLTIYFDLDPALGLERINKTLGREINRLDCEQLSFHQKVRQGFLEIAQIYPQRIKIVDASLPLDTVTKQVLDLLFQALKKE